MGLATDRRAQVIKNYSHQERNEFAQKCVLLVVLHFSLQSSFLKTFRFVNLLKKCPSFQSQIIFHQNITAFKKISTPAIYIYENEVNFIIVDICRLWGFLYRKFLHIFFFFAFAIINEDYYITLQLFFMYITANLFLISR